MSRATRFLDACAGRPVDKTPIWVMRQAGRILSSYQALKERYSFTEMAHTPELSCEVTLMPLSVLDVDAAILFSDIMMVPEAMGMEVSYHPEPILSDPVREGRHVERLRVPDCDDACSFVMESIRMVRREIEGVVPLIGFAGAPFTVASYMVEGRGSKTFSEVKRLLFSRPELAHRLLARVADATAAYLAAQIRAGAQAVQLFESWAGLLDAAHFEEFALRYARRVVDMLTPATVPIIYFPHGAPWCLGSARASHADVVGIDWRVSLSQAIDILGEDVVVQGNMDPSILFAPEDVIAREAASILAQGKRARGHVFNLGHGVLPETDPAKVRLLVDRVHEYAEEVPDLP